MKKGRKMKSLLFPVSSSGRFSSITISTAITMLLSLIAFNYKYQPVCVSAFMMKYNHHPNKRLDVQVQVLNSNINDNNDDEQNNNNNNDDNNSDDEQNKEFYRDLQKAKMKNFGRALPPEQLRESAIQAESDFLTAMKETKKDFQKIKNEVGSDGAVDVFLERIRKEEEEENDDVDDDDEDDEDDDGTQEQI
jgi:hypothetical protein